MAQAIVRWVHSKTFVGTDSNQHSVVLSTKDDGVGMKPSELVMVALGSCTAVDVVDILAKKRIKLTSLEIDVTGEQEANPPWTFRKFHLSYKLSGEGLDAKSVEQAVQLSQDKYCSVAATLRGSAEITWDYQIV